jgi:hypothetical protein
MQPRDPLTRTNACSIMENERPARAADIETKNTGWISGVFEHGLAPA